MFRADLADGKLVAIGLLPGAVLPAVRQTAHVRSTVAHLPARAPPFA
jgi:hypothetical protein